MPRIVSPTDEMIAEASQRLRAGEVVAFPTETVYGLGADTFNPVALKRIYKLKGRPFDNPLIAHVLDHVAAERLMIGTMTPSEVRSAIETHSHLPIIADLTARFWPGPLTLVVPKSPQVPERATAGRPTIAVRSPAHLVARRLLQTFGSPISAPSANRSGHVSPTTAQHVADDFADVDDLLIIDGGMCEIGIESTVLDVTTSPPRVLRPGSVTLEQLHEAIGEVDAAYIEAQSESPGTSPQHYAPHTPAELVRSAALADRLQQLSQPAAVLTFHTARVMSPHHAIVMPTNADQYAHQLYDALRRADALHMSRIVIETPPADGSDVELWRSIRDRLRRATR